ncbi:MAG: DUF4129 domain-containing protein [Roseburia sp.]|nr:DUF4129 domain-containing protein [Roseburia sp.]
MILARMNGGVGEISTAGKFMFGDKEESMDYRHRYQIIVFLYHYLCAVCFLVVSALAADSTVRAYLIFVIAMALCYFIANFKLGHKKKTEKDPDREKHCHMTVFGAVLAVAAFFQADDFMEEKGLAFVLGELLFFVLILGITAVYIYADYFREKYLTMYANPCVGKETIRRFEKNTGYALKRVFIAWGLGMLLLFLVVSSISTTDVERTSQRQQTEEPVRKAKTDKLKKERQQDIEKKEKEERSPFQEMLLRILMLVMQVFLGLLFIVGVATVLFFLLKKFFAIRLPQFSRVEKSRVRQTVGTDEYIPLRPVLRRKEEFPGDPNGKIRRSFTRYMKKKSGGQVDVSLTPEEMAEAYLAGEGGNVTEEERGIVELYEKARYSGESCSEEEAERMRSSTIHT